MDKFNKIYKNISSRSDYEKIALLLTGICGFIALLQLIIMLHEHDDGTNSSAKSMDDKNNESKFSQVDSLIQDANREIFTKNYSKSIEILIYANSLLSNLTNKDNRDKLYFTTQMLLGDCYVNLSKIRDKKINANKAINSYMNANNGSISREDSEEAANIKKKLGIAYCILSDIEYKKENLLRAINLHEEALEICKKNKDSEDCASIMDCLGTDWRLFSEMGDIKRNLNRSLENYSQAFFLKDNNGIHQNNLGILYQQLAEIENNPILLDDSIEYFNMALENSTYKSLEFAEVQHNIASAYYSRYHFFQQENDLEKSLRNYSKALNIRTEKDYPLYYADTVINMASVNISYSELNIPRSEKEVRLNETLRSLDKAHQIAENEFLYIESANAEHNKGIIYISLYKIFRDKDYLNNAKTAFMNAKETPSYQEHKLDFALTNQYLGDVFASLSEFNNCMYNNENAKEAYDQSTKIYLKEGLPLPLTLVSSQEIALGKACT